MNEFINELVGPLAFLLPRNTSPYTGVINFTILLFCCILYVLEAVGVMRIAQKCEIKHSWLALVPVVGLYTMGRVAFENKAKAYLLLVANVVPAFVTLLTLWYPTDLNATLLLCKIGVRILSFLVSYKIYKKMSNQATLMLILSVLSGGLLTSIFIFAIRNNVVLKK